MSAQSIVDLCRVLDRARTHYGIGVLSGERFDVKAADKLIADLAKQADRFSQLVTPVPGKHYPTLAEKIAVLTIALETIANRQGAAIVPSDTLLALVVDACPTPDAAQFWSKEWPASLFGLVLHEPRLAAELRTRGVLVWGEHADGLTRLVNASWLTTHAEIFRFVTGDRPAGNRCRFCRLSEPHGVLLTDVETPTGDWKRPQFPIPLHVQAHRQCAPYWLEWLAVARQYQSEDEATAADVAAGRAQDAVPALPAPIAEPAAPTHVESNDE
jgi:hypothetical protein